MHVSLFGLHGKFHALDACINLEHTRVHSDASGEETLEGQEPFAEL